FCMISLAWVRPMPWIYCSATSTRFWVGMLTPAIRAMVGDAPNAIDARPPNQPVRGASRVLFREGAVIAGRNAASTSRSAPFLRLFGSIRRIKMGARGLNARLVADGPLAQCGDRFQEVATEVCELIIHARGDGGGDGAPDQPVALEIAQGERQHAL